MIYVNRDLRMKIKLLHLNYYLINCFQFIFYDVHFEEYSTVCHLRGILNLDDHHQQRVHLLMRGRQMRYRQLQGLQVSESK